MDQIRKFLPFHSQREQQRSYNYLHKNGSLLMEDLIATFGPRYKIPIRNFTSEELIGATNNFSEKLFYNDFGDFYKGNLEERPVFVNCFCRIQETAILLPYFIRDIVVASQMSHHKNVLPLVGCCLELECPAMVYDNTLDHEFVYELLIPTNNGNAKLVSGRDRIRIAKDISNVLIYLHTAFPSPIIFRDLKLKNVAIDQWGAAKLFGFGHSISLPPGELKVEDSVKGAFGYLDPEYFRSGFVTEKTDVYSIGVVMMAVFAGQPPVMVEPANDEVARTNPEKVFINIKYHVKNCITNNRFQQCIDPKIFEEEGQNEHQILQHLLPLSTLALRCTEEKGINRPEMVEVAKQLSQAEKSLRS